MGEPNVPFINLADKQEPESTPRWSLLSKQVKPDGCGEYCLLVAIIICILAGKLVVLLTPLTWGSAVGAISGESPDVREATFWVLMYCCLSVLADGFNQTRGALWGRLSNRLTRRIAVRLFAHLHSLSLRWHLNRKTGEVLRIVDIGVKAITSFVSVLAFSMGPTVLELILVSGIFLRIGVPLISVCVLVAAALYVGYTIIVTKLRTRQRRETNEASKSMQDKAVDSLLNFETVKLFAAESREVSSYQASAETYERAMIRSQDSLSVLNWGQTICMQLGVAGGLLTACLQSDMSVGKFVMIQMYIMQIFRPLISLGSNYNSLMQAATDLEKMTELLAVQPEIKEKDDAQDLRMIFAKLQRWQQNVQFDNVTFFYQPGKPGGVKNLSFSMDRGSSVALVGPSGSGKSTSTRLLSRLMEVSSGSVRIGNTDVREVSQESLRKMVSVVSQDTVLFNSSIRFNLTYGKPDATQEEISRATSLAQVDTFLHRMEDGYETTVGERGLRLSGGEKQRLGIARAVLTDPIVLVLDEATSALDTTTERDVQRAIDTASAGRCTLMIAHRLSTIVGATEIIVLRNGEVVERGAHQALLQAKGLFHDMWKAQQELQDGEDSVGCCKKCIEFCAAKCKDKRCLESGGIQGQSSSA